MKRDIVTKLKNWKNSVNRKPLILQGARQVGKTYTLKEFGKNYYENTVYINFEKEDVFFEIFKNISDVKKIIDFISIKTSQIIKPQKTLIIFDEIQSFSPALNSLKYFNEDANEYHIASAGSLLGITLSNTKSFPVGKVNFLDMYPLNFFEFLSALNKDTLRNYIEGQTNDLENIPLAFHIELIDILKIYYFIGGMPEAVAVYLKTKNMANVRTIQNEILRAYRNDFSKHVSKSDIIKINNIFNSIPKHLSKENKRFIFSAIKNSARSKDYEYALQWLLDAGIVYKVNCISKPQLPLMAFTKQAFKIYFVDIGLLAAFTNLSQTTIVDGKSIFTYFKGAMVENFVIQQLKIDFEDLYYWQSEGKAEIDLIISDGSNIIPIEIKAGKNTKSKSLSIYDKKFNPKYALQCNLNNFEKSNRFYNYPLYSTSLICKHFPRTM